MEGILLIIFYFTFPALVLYLESRYEIVRKIGAIIICYAVGLLIGNAGILWEGVLEFQNLVMTITVPLAIPLLLFSLNFRRWIKMAGDTFLSMILGLISVFCMAIPGYYIFRDQLPEMWKIAGMAIGLYSGGTPNLAAIARGLGVEEELYIMTHTAELVIGALILLFLLTGAKPFFGLWLKPYQRTGDQKDQPEIDVADFESYEGFFRRKTVPGILRAFGVAAVIFGIGYGTTFLFEGDAGDTAAVLTVTTLGILASLVPSVNRIRSSFQLGMYFIYVFCVIVASKADIIALFSVDNINLLYNLLLYIAIVIVGSLLLHSILSWIFGINVDDFIITSTALSNSPPFVPVVAAALRNKEVVVPGMIIGVIGYAIGNYLGVAIAYLLR